MSLTLQPPVKGVGLGVGNLVAVGLTASERIWGTGVEVANRDLVARTKGVEVTKKTRVGVGANPTVGVGTLPNAAGAAV